MGRYTVHKCIVILLFFSLSLSHNFFSLSQSSSSPATPLNVPFISRIKTCGGGDQVFGWKGRPARRIVESLGFNEALLPQPSPTDGDDTSPASKETHLHLGGWLQFADCDLGGWVKVADFPDASEFGRMGFGCWSSGGYSVWVANSRNFLVVFRKFLGWVAVCLVRWWSRDGCMLSGAAVMPCGCRLCVKVSVGQCGVQKFPVMMCFIWYFLWRFIIKIDYFNKIEKKSR